MKCFSFVFQTCFEMVNKESLPLDVIGVYLGASSFLLIQYINNAFPRAEAHHLRCC